MKSPEFYREQRKWYNKLARQGFVDIENGYDSPPTLLSSGGGNTARFSMNAVQAASGRPMQQLDSYSRGSEWEELISDQDRNVDTRRSATGTYIHYAQLIAAQEYELQRLGKGRRASRNRTAWTLHAQGLSERAIARICETTRHEIRSFIRHLEAVIRKALDNTVEV
jgi:hypothetical protein